MHNLADQSCLPFPEVRRPSTASPPPTDGDICDINPCQNGGTCTPDKSLGFSCLCPLGKGGAICKEGKLDMQSVTELNQQLIVFIICWPVCNIGQQIIAKLFIHAKFTPIFQKF